MGTTIAFEEAEARLYAAALPIEETERVDLAEARGRVLAERVAADRDHPPADRSAMDGFAVRSADLEAGPATLRVVAELRAGRPVGDVRVGPGEAVRIMTGAILPPGADAVVMVERSREARAAGTVAFDDRPPPGQHVRRRGEELTAGSPVLEPGVAIRAAETAALASVGRARVRVVRRPAVAVLATGDELLPVGGPPPAEHQIRNSNAPALLAQLAELGLAGEDLGVAADDERELGARLARGLEADCLLVTGGVSAGEYDRVARALEAAGVRTLFHGVAVKPGKPVLAGRRGRCLVVGLPGNPVSTFTMFAVLVAPALRRMAGLAAWRRVELRAALATDLASRPGRVTFHLAELAVVGGGLRARPTATAGSGDVLALARANGFVVTSPDSHGEPAGTELRAIPWALASAAA